MAADNPDPRIHLRSDADVVGLFGASLRQYAVYTLLPDGTVSSWNPGAERMTGVAAADVIGRNISMFYTPQQIAEGVPEHLLQRTAELGTSSEEGWRLRQDGTIFWAHVSTTALHSETGELRGFARITRDETETHNRLERSLRQFRDLFALTPVAIGLFNRYGYVLDSNEALCSLLGYQPDDVHGAHVSKFVHSDEPQRASVLAGYATGEPPDVPSTQEWSLVTVDGARVYCSVHMARSTAATGHPFWLIAFENVTERHHHAEELRNWAIHDEVTGLPNRAGVPPLLAVPDPERLAVFYCDVNKFRRINESLGHGAGDELLGALGRRLRATLPDGWSAARFAGDEFVIVCPDAEAAGGIERAATLVDQLFRTTVPLRGEYVDVSASIGVASCSDGIAVDDLVRLASAADLHYKGPKAGSIALASAELIESVGLQLHLEGELRDALANDALHLEYQPIVGADGDVVSCEALVRWWHPERGLLSPGVFLPVAEQGGLMRELDRWVLRRALTEAAQWPVSHNGFPVSVSVNLSELLPGESELVDDLTALVRDTGITWERIVLEIVETALIDLPESVLKRMRELAGRGVRFAVDDFGTGYSSLGRLKEIPAEIIKVDRRFVADVATDKWDHALVKAIVDITHAAGGRCIGEGVETLEQLETLSAIGVTAYQGWLFAHAMPSAELCTLIRNGVSVPMRG
ncbi:EAL domain-containing protein [Allosaccharopolyspora coralli]|uniref:EAL domain-containing protein n=1 Tax=Allosaccharopolyspora coralli TaxID=2665642 RepID=A0A5Q3QAX6_9PSEU|nr:EAL domain-containing protein [Allosaccharopolyspora coralli]QGK68625.1 EAL domain-containing protein [Allosaccharopolyspora coralli]